MINVLKKYPIHVFLYVSFLIVFLYQENDQHLELGVIMRSFFICLLVSISTYLIIYFFLKDKIKAGLVTTALNLILFNYGIIYDVVEKLYFHGFWPFKNIHRYLLFFSLVYVVIVFWLIIKKLRNGAKLNYFLNVLFSFLLIYNLLLLAINSMHLQVNNDLRTQESNGKSTHLKLPNVYYIVLDGYANNTVLKEFYNYDNSPFLNSLNENGFYVADSSFSNYYSTLPSLAATLNMSYHSKNSDLMKLLKNNLVFSKLKEYGYKIINLESGFSVTESFTLCDSTISIHSPNEFERSLMKFTILRLDDLFGILHFKRLSNQVKCLKDIKPNNGKTFYFIHIVAPHPPYVFDENGRHLYSSKTHHNSWEPKEKYIQQLKYINKVVSDLLKQISTNDVQAAVILQSDHGPWISEVREEDVFKARSMILNAFRFPGKNLNQVQKHISSVNTFRIFFKNYIDSSFLYLNDSSAGKTELLQSVRFKDLKVNDLHE